jgi:hypothetical protein
LCGYLGDQASSLNGLHDVKDNSPKRHCLPSSGHPMILS